MIKSLHKLESRLRCVECGGSLQKTSAGYICKKCECEFGLYLDVPVFLREDNSLFVKNSYVECASDNKSINGRCSWRTMVKRLIPSKSVNLCRARVLADISESVADDSSILVIGCGTQRKGLEAIFKNKTENLVFSDIDQNADCDVYADAHVLPFKDELFDGVITTAVLEHVLEPWIVAGEIARVTKCDGFVYSELPFLQGVHEGAYDFARFTMGGHRGLFRCYEEVESGIVAGPRTAFVWCVSALTQSLFKNQKWARIADVVARVLFGWVKYLDFIIQQHPMAEDFASCTFYRGLKSNRKFDHQELIERYRGKSYLHTKQRQ